MLPDLEVELNSISLIYTGTLIIVTLELNYKTICIEVITKNKYPIQIVLPMQQDG
jgi:hypothetical protein